ncbi:MAG: transposase [Chloroflexales bacterium]|nr:transposase [Chloroflexales bacterium]
MIVAPVAVPVQSEAYETDLTDAEWEILRPHLEVRAKTGPERKVDLRRVFNALRYKLRTGCQWRLLPKSFPPKSTVSYYFQQWTKQGVLMRLNDLLRRQVRTEVEGREHVYDGAGAVRVFEATARRGIRLKKIWADQTYRGTLRAWMAERQLGDLEIVDRLPGQRGFQVQPRRWVVERTHAWMGRNRQLSKEYDHNPHSSESWLYLASIRLLTRRLTKAA